MVRQQECNIAYQCSFIPVYKTCKASLIEHGPSNQPSNLINQSTNQLEVVSKSQIRLKDKASIWFKSGAYT